MPDAIKLKGSAAQPELAAVVRGAEDLGVKLAIHPDDPPFPLFGLPRCVSTADDLAFLLAAQSSPANGSTFCTDSLGARGDNNLPTSAALKDRLN